MNIMRQRKRFSSSSDSTPISAMIDIVFLLLIYFILTQKPIIEDTLLNFSPARRGNSGNAASEISDFVFLEINENQENYLFNSQAIPRNQLLPCLIQLSKNNSNTKLVIFCADHIKHSILVETLDICRNSPIKNISIMSK